MEIKSTLVKDTNGDLSTDTFKIYIDNPAVTVSLSDMNQEKRTLNLALNNIRFDSIPNINNSTYKTFLTYNGTLGYSKKIFTSVVMEDSGIFNVNAAPTMEYNPGEVIMPDPGTLDEVVIDIKMYNGTVDVLRYSEGILKDGEKSYFVKSRQAFPTDITGLPNVAGNKVFMDGWYSYTTVIFRNLTENSIVMKDSFYGFEGFIFKASDDGKMFKNASTGEIYILKTGDVLLEEGIIQTANENYEEILFSLNESTGFNAQANNIYLHSQVLVLDQIRDAITTEAVEAAFAPQGDYVDFQDWQKLTLKRMSAAVMFENELFENAQIIVESARSFCTKGRYNSKCN